MQSIEGWEDAKGLLLDGGRGGSGDGCGNGGGNGNDGGMGSGQEGSSGSDDNERFAAAMVGVFFGAAPGMALGQFVDHKTNSSCKCKKQITYILFSNMKP